MPTPVYAAGIGVEPLTWNIIGLDSNKPEDGPNHFPVGARICNNTGGPISNVKTDFIWDSTTNSTYIYERPGTDTSIVMFVPTDAALADGDCADFYFEIEVLKDRAAYNKARRYHIEVTSTETGAAVYSTPRPRELFVEYLVSQSRNAVTDVQYGTDLASLASVPQGGTMSLIVGNTYYIKLVGFTATQGYNQLESFINFPNTIFQVLSVESVYSAPSAGYTIDKMYSDACGWDNVISSPTYRSCIVSDDKTGGDIAVTYQVKILSVPGGVFTNPEPLSTLIYDFSGSSYHYNADFGISTRYAYVLDPASVDISKSFTPSTIAPGSTSTLTFTLTNSAPVTAAGVSFEDDLPSLSDGVTNGQMVADPATYSTSGCGTASTMNFSPASDATSLSFSGGMIAPNGTCTVSVSVSIPDAPTSGDYSNISDNVFVGGLDSGDNAAADLTIDASTVTTGTGVCGQKLVEWIMDPSQGTTSPPNYWPATKSSGVDGATTLASSGNGLLTGISTVSTDGDPANSWWGSGFAKTGTPDPDTSPYLQFRVDTTNFTDLKMNFRVMVDPNWASSATVYAYSSTTGLPGSFTSIGSHANLVASTYTTPTGTPWAASQTGSNSTYFRVYMIGANNAGAKVFLDNVVFTGCGPAEKPRLTKAFTTNPVVVGGTSTLTFHIFNPNSGPLTGVNFADVLPAGLTIVDGAIPTVTCDTGSGSGTLTTTATDTITFTAGVIPANTTCHVTTPVSITANTSDPHNNISGFISSTESGTNSDPTGSAKASLVALLPPTIEKVFNPSSILANETTTLTFIITNPNSSDDLPNVAFGDSLPSGMTLAVDVTTPQCGGMVTGAAATDVIGFSGGTVSPGGTCMVSVEVTASGLGDYVNTSDPVTTTIGGLTSGTDTATAALTVEAPNPAISILKRVSTTSTGPWSTFLTVAPTTPVYYQFTVENVGDVDLDTVSVSDPTLTGLGLDLSSCAWATLPRYSDAVICVTAPTPALAGNNPNTATAQGTYTVGGETKTGTSSASYVGVTVGALNLSKQISTSPFGPWSSSIVDVAPGSTVYYKFTIVNATGGTLASINVTDVDPAVDTTGCTFTDPLPDSGATTCVVSATVPTTGSATHTNTAIAHGLDAGSNPVDSSPSSADYTPTSPIGSLSNTANLTYTSLAEGVTTGDPNGTCPNATGSCAPATSALTPELGERNGTGGPINIYSDIASIDITVSVALIDAVDDSASGVNGLSGAVGVLNVFDNDTLDGALVNPVDLTLTLQAGGDPELALNADGSVDIAPNTPACSYSFDYQICENLNPANCDIATVTIMIVNRPPLATDNESSVDAATPDHTANVVTDDEGHGADSDPDGDPLIVTGIDGVTNPAIDLTGTYGTLDWAADGSYTYTLDTSDPDYLVLAVGATVIESFSYTISDGNGGTDTADIIITITGADDVPVANDDNFTTPEDTSLNDDLKPDNGTGADLPSDDGGNDWSVVAVPSHGTVTINSDGAFTYTPDAGYNGSDSFTYQICDVDNDCDPATVNLMVTSVEDPAIGIAKRVASVTRVGSGTFDVTWEFYVRNYGDVPLSNIQLTDDLTATFSPASTFTVQSVTISGVTNAALTANPGYNGSTDTNLLTVSGNTLAINGSGKITVIVRVLPSSAGPFYNSANASGETPTGVAVTDESSDGTDPDDTSNCPACINGDGDPTNNTRPTPVSFDPNIFDPPFGIKIWMHPGCQASAGP